MKPTQWPSKSGIWFDPRGRADRRIDRHQNRRARERQTRREIEDES